MPVVIPGGVQVNVANGVVTAKGPKGELKEALHSLVKAEVKDGKVLLTADLKAAKDAFSLDLLKEFGMPFKQPAATAARN